MCALSIPIRSKNDKGVISVFDQAGYINPIKLTDTLQGI